MTVIKVPEIPGPTKQLCYAPQPLLEGMARCDRAKGHTGPHTWEFPTWHPIDTAPKDGTKVIVFARDGDKVKYWAVGSWFVGDDGSSGWVTRIAASDPEFHWLAFLQPTHWQPMLSTPEAK